MKTYTKKLLPALVAALAVLDLILMVAMRSAWSGIASVTKMAALPYVLAAVMILSAGASVLFLLWKAPRPFVNGLLGLSLFFLGALLYILSQTIGDWPIILREFLIGLAWTAAAAFLLFLLTGYRSSRLASSGLFKALVIAAAIFAFTVGVLDLAWLRLDHGPVAWAVGDEYQIAFTTTARARAWVEVGGREYHDSYAGYDVSETRVHKVSVPMAALDAAKSYTVHARSMIMRGPYAALQGRSVSEEVAWRPLDPSDGLQAYAISDTHEAVESPVRAASFEGQALDLLVIAGDTSSYLDRPSDITRILDLAHGVTGGSRPAVYARGNHETKGLSSTTLDRYVGADGNRFRYSFRVGPLWGVVLDLGEDHPDDWWEFYGAARFDAYREEETRFLDDLVARADEEYLAPGVEWRLAICHIPVTLRSNDDHATAFKRAWIERLDRMGIDLMLNGHLHEAIYVPADLPADKDLLPVEAYRGESGSAKKDGQRLASNFPAVVISRRSEVQTTSVPEDLFHGRFLGLSLRAPAPGATTDTRLELRFTDENGSIVRTVQPWTGADYGEVIKVPTVIPAGDPASP